MRLLAWSLVFAAFSVWACSVPVFRYALEHWDADRYEVCVVHQGEPSREAAQIVEAESPLLPLANHKLRRVDLAKEPMPGIVDAALLAASPNKAFLVVKSPPLSRVPGVVWSGPLTAESWAAVFDSPARKTIAERLGNGESAVWVFLESGDKEADDAAVALLQARLDYLSTVMELPKLDEQDIRNGLVSLPPDGLQLAFSILRLSRSDPAEQFLTQMLLATEPDLKQLREPMVFPVFGRGRALYALVGKGIRHETIDEAASFLIGSCSCQVKEQNPGADLLMAVDWKGLVRNQASGLEDLPAASEITGGMPEVVVTAPRGADPAEALPGVPVNRFITVKPALVLGCVAALLLTGAFLLVIRKSRTP